jgi:hypothetical protein
MEGGAIGNAGAPRLHPDPLPCLKKNNSTEIPYLECLNPDEQARLKALLMIENSPVKKLPDGRFVQTFKDGTEVILGGMSRSELKTAFVLEQNVAKLFRDYPIERVAFMTITFPKSVVTPKEASRRFNSFRTHFLRDYADVYIKVTEPHKDKRPHYHLLVVLPSDIRTGFDWVAFEAAKLEYKTNGKSQAFRDFTKRYSASAPKYLRRFWSSFRHAAKAHKLGRTEVLPIKSEAEAAVRYVGKYIEKGSVHRTGVWKGVRLVSCARSLERAANCRFSWAQSGKKWRSYVSEVAAILNINDLSEFSLRYGTKWAYKILQCSQYEFTPNQTASLIQKSIRL